MNDKLAFVFLLFLLVNCSEPETHKSKGTYFKTEIELALEKNDYEKAEDLCIEMGVYVLNLTIDEVREFHSAWPSPEAGIKWVDEVKAKINRNASKRKPDQ